MHGRVALAALVVAGATSITAGVLLAFRAPHEAATSQFEVPTSVPVSAPPTTAPAALPLASTTAPSSTGPTAPIPNSVVPVVAPPITVSLLDRGIVAEIVPVGVGPDGGLQLPEHPATVGWWAAGAVPGASTGHVVLAGHIDSARLGIGAFAALLDVEPGETVEITTSDGAVRGYRIVGRSLHPKAALPAEIFDGEAPHALVLVTCGGEFDRRTGHYEDNVVVYAEGI